MATILNVSWQEDAATLTQDEADARAALDAEWNRRGLGQRFVERQYRDKHAWMKTREGETVVIRAVYREQVSALPALAA